MTALLELENVEVVYHHVATAVQGVSLQVPDRSIVALLGTNGAGKTTTLRAISGFLGGDEAQVVAGRIAFRGETITGRRPHEIARRGLVLVPERDKVFETLTVQENLLALVPGPRRLVTREQVTDLGAVLAGDAAGRPGPDAVTLFDSTGLAIQDLAVAAAAYGAWRDGDVEAQSVRL